MLQLRRRAPQHFFRGKLYAECGWFLRGNFAGNGGLGVVLARITGSLRLVWGKHYGFYKGHIWLAVLQGEHCGCYCMWANFIYNSPSAPTNNGRKSKIGIYHSCKISKMWKWEFYVKLIKRELLKSAHFHRNCT